MDLLAAVAASMLPLSRGRVAAALKELRLNRGDAPVPEVLAALGIPPDARGALARGAHEAAAAALACAGSTGIDPVPWFDARYPALLNCITDPPPVLWVRGRAEVLGRRAVAIVGSRAATPYALDVGRRLGAELAERGVVVASGLARGVDSAAHRGCLDAGGITIGVLGSGLDRIYPTEHEALAASITKDGALVSELGPGGPPLPEHFPLRNRIISGISLAVVVVEASDKSGSLITARCGLEQGRDVMAVPGSILSGRNRGSHRLLKDGAKVVESADDILEELGWPPAAAGSSLSDGTRPESAAKSLTEEPLVGQMAPGEWYGLDQLAMLTGLTAARLLTRLMQLELAGRVRTAGGRFARVTGRE